MYATHILPLDAPIGTGRVNVWTDPGDMVDGDAATQPLVVEGVKGVRETAFPNVTEGITPEGG